jgi:hypothetical protein
MSLQKFPVEIPVAGISPENILQQTRSTAKLGQSIERMQP